VTNFHAQTIESVLKELRTSLSGLKEETVIESRQKYGQNKIKEEKAKTSLAIFFSQFKSPLILILVFAGIISFLFKEYIDAGVIFISVFLNTIIGFFQENKANNALAKLKSMVEHKALVIRDGKELEIESFNVVLGDLIILKSGNRVPADARLIEAIDLEIEEASLTGESVPAVKAIEKIAIGSALADRNNMAYASTIIVRGSGKAIVTAIGGQTEIGQIAELVEATPEEATPLQKRLAQLSASIGKLVGVICLLIIIIGLWQGRDFFEMLITGIAVAVAAVPEGLAMAITVILVLGMQRMLKRQALVRKLLAAETLGSATVICTDKTGTLTTGKMEVAHVILSEKEFKLEDLKTKSGEKEFEQLAMILKIGALCNDSFAETADNELEPSRFVGTPTEVALLSAARQIGLEKDDLLSAEPRVNEFPFDNELKLMATLHEQGQGFVLYEKGAPERILERSGEYFVEGKVVKLSAEKKEKLNRLYEKLTERGLRVLGFAYKKIKSTEAGEIQQFDWAMHNRGLVFVGFVAIKDPLRPEAKETIKTCLSAGIRPVIITGDHPLTARAIAREIGLPVGDSNVLTGTELDKIDDEKLKTVIKQIDIYARVSPHHKLRIIQAWKALGESVAMTGDGINDSPALKAADIGVALGTGTDIAKENSDLVLLDNNFQTIVSAIMEGRIILANIKKVLTYSISDSFSEALLIIGSMFFGLPLALAPVQILWINIVNDGLPNFSLAFEREEVGMSKQKTISSSSIFDPQMKTIIFFAGVIRNFIVLFIFVYLMNNFYSTEYARTIIFAIFGVASLLSVFSLRSFERPVWRINFFSNGYLLLAFVISFILLLMAIYLPFLQGVMMTVALSAKSWLLVLAIGLANIFMIELIKYYFSAKTAKGRI